jgi:hypothetical protein
MVHEAEYISWLVLKRYIISHEHIAHLLCNSFSRVHQFRRIEIHMMREVHCGSIKSYMNNDGVLVAPYYYVRPSTPRVDISALRP